MKSPVTKLATAAIIVVACVIGLSLWTGTQSGIALADVLTRLEQVKTYRSKGTFTANGQIAPGRPSHYETHWTSVVSQEFGFKTNIEIPDPNGGWSPVSELYLCTQKKTYIEIKHPAKRYVRREFGDEEVQQSQKEGDITAEPGAFIKRIMACKYESLGRSTVNGVEVEGFRTTDPNCRTGGLQSRVAFKDPRVDLKVWVDVKTRLPVRHDDLASGLDERGNTTSHRFVTDFEWDVPVTAADFDPPPVPDGYVVLDNPPPKPRDEEKTALQGLKKCIELFGNYLETMGDHIGLGGATFLALEKSETPAALQLKEEMKGLTEQQKQDRVFEVTGAVRHMDWLYGDLVQQKKDPAYYGKTVTPKDADKVLMRWKLSDNEYRVIFGDLRAETVSPEKLADLEKALPK